MTERSRNRVLRDAIGKGLTKEEVRILARANARASNEMIDVDTMTEADLIQWAAGPDERYVDEQVASYGWKYR